MALIERPRAISGIYHLADSGGSSHQQVISVERRSPFVFGGRQRDLYSFIAFGLHAGASVTEITLDIRRHTLAVFYLCNSGDFRLIEFHEDHVISKRVLSKIRRNT